MTGPAGPRIRGCGERLQPRGKAMDTEVRGTTSTSWKSYGFGGAGNDLNFVCWCSRWKKEIVLGFYIRPSKNLLLFPYTSMSSNIALLLQHVCSSTPAWLKRTNRSQQPKIWDAESQSHATQNAVHRVDVEDGCAARPLLTHLAKNEKHTDYRKMYLYTAKKCTCMTWFCL